MSHNEDDKKHKGEIVFLQRVFDCHNEKYGTRFEIKGETTKLYPQLKGQTCWDWVGDDAETGNNIAIEFKRITEEKLEEIAKVTYTVLNECANDLKGNLSGHFLLSVNIDDFRFPFKGKSCNRKLFKGILSLAIEQTAQRLEVGETKDLKPQITDKLPFNLPNIMFFDLIKLGEEGSELYLNPMIGSSWSIGFNESEIKEFEGLVSHANLQLSLANTDETFLILIEEGYRPIDPPEIEESFVKIESKSYSKIKHVYFVRGQEKPSEIRLPTP